ncbi:DUF2931 family protein [Vibrio sp. TRT 17S01]|uniref:DUF2931 family protein n=1 Tax=Vibrio sp. TRT 17S01 TaxID=3418505 RepID=UPI003CEF47C2
MLSNVFLQTGVVLTLCSCTSFASVPETSWRVSIAAPSLYPVNVTQSYGINEHENWTSSLHNFTQFMRVTDIKNVRKRFPRYDGFGIPIQDYTMIRSRQVSPTNHIPEVIYLYWVSLANTQFYVTKYPVSNAVKKAMRMETSYTRGDGATIDSCYRIEFVFGLFPNGQAKVFLKGCGELIFLTDLAPDSILDKDSNGFGIEDYMKKSYFKRIQKRAEDAGVVIDPVSWDKVNKIYSKENIIELH